MFTKWALPYRTISRIEIKPDTLIVSFKDGGTATIKHSVLAPSGAKKIRWHEARVEDDGSCINIPGDPVSLEIPWDVVRKLTDENFARHMAKIASEQAKHIGARLRELRESRGLTQAKVASIAGIEPANLSRIENGQFDISTSTLWRLLAAMGYSARDLAPQREELKAS